MNWLKQYYGKDTGAKVAGSFILLFLGALVVVEPRYWWVAVTALVAYLLLFYVMRKNP